MQYVAGGIAWSEFEFPAKMLLELLERPAGR